MKEKPSLSHFGTRVRFLSPPPASFIATLSLASRALGLARSTVYYQRSIDPDFDAAWMEALEQDADRYEDALEQLATKTKNVGAVIFGLKNKRPGKWQDRHDVNVDKREVKYNVSLPALQEQELLAIIRSSLDSGTKLLGPHQEERS